MKVRQVGEKQSFFEKKDQKTFDRGRPDKTARCRLTATETAKVFWFFFSRKNDFLP
jgi:hypothetical protein